MRNDFGRCQRTRTGAGRIVAAAVVVRVNDDADTPPSDPSGPPFEGKGSDLGGEKVTLRVWGLWTTPKSSSHPGYTITLESER